LIKVVSYVSKTQIKTAFQDVLITKCKIYVINQQFLYVFMRIYAKKRHITMILLKYNDYINFAVHDRNFRNFQNFGKIHKNDRRLRQRKPKINKYKSLMFLIILIMKAVTLLPLAATVSVGTRFIGIIKGIKEKQNTSSFPKT